MQSVAHIPASFCSSLHEIKTVTKTRVSDHESKSSLNPLGHKLSLKYFIFVSGSLKLESPSLGKSANLQRHDYPPKLTKRARSPIIKETANRQTHGNSGGAAEIHSLEGIICLQDPYKSCTPQLWPSGLRAQCDAKC
ncbi:hypothetical protein ATANTOWER_003758 [Ataeniobius toweri]|uniref:Uncharacterized protein n=1 Tax=Ataeniobius toweri TaxID=208326 RepID=A0ABU7BGH9_9TELE|nr:hypothetical protein [Ataeniobius toweri]